MFELTRNFLRFYFPYHMNTVNREQELENLQKDHVIDELNQAEAELTKLRSEVDRLKQMAELGEAFEYAVQNEVRFIRQMSNGERLAFVDKYDKAKLLKIFNEILEENKSMKACIYRCQEQGGEFNE